jgi:hypothetical protein
LPGITLFGLFVLSTWVPRPLEGGSALFDLAPRLYVALMYCVLFLIVEDIPRYERWIWGRSIEVNPAEGDVVRAAWDTGMSIMGFALTAIMTYFVIQTFVPILSGYALVVATAYGLLGAVPLYLRPFRM